MAPVIKGLVIGGTHSGSGKSTLTLGLLAALKRRGFKVAPYKVGPDYIDPSHHSTIAGVAGCNLDGWMLDRRTNCRIFDAAAHGADAALIEGVMGLYDGYDGKSEAGSTAQMAKWLGLPVLLVVDARSMARSAAAVVQGFENFDRRLQFAGVVFNNLGSPRHLLYLQEALADHVRMPLLGGLYRDEAIGIPERHLGLLTAQDHPLDASFQHQLADLIESGLDVEKLLERMPNRELGNDAGPIFKTAAGESVRIGVARDNAFCFYYEHNLKLLEACGARIVPFSPVRDDRLPEPLDGIYLGGGYPELYAAQLAGNRSLKNQIKACSRSGMPIYAECGGFMYLCRHLCDPENNRYEMTGCFPFATRMLPRLKSLGYREVHLERDCLLGKAGRSIRGHEFHYSELIEPEEPVATVYQVAARAGNRRSPEGFLVQNTLGSYIHLHFGSRPEAAADFAAACRRFRKERTVGP